MFDGRLSVLRLLFAALPFTFVEAAAAQTETAQTETRPSPWGGELRLGAGVGGDEVASVTYDNGQTSDLAMGTHFTLSAGAIYGLWTSSAHTLELAATLGFASNSTGPENTEDRLSFRRFPAELLAYYRFRFPDPTISIRAGAGPAYHFVTGISGSGSLEQIEIDVDNALGAAFELALNYDQLSLGARYIWLRLTADQATETLDGSSIGGFLSLYIGSY